VENPKVEQYVNPDKVSRVKSIIIQEDDPRNNQSFLESNPNVVVVPTYNSNPDTFSYENISDENFDPIVLNAEFHEIAIENHEELIPSPYFSLQEPQDLNIDSSTFKVQTDAADGTVYYTATLSFDDVDHAASYEVRINAITS